MFGTDAVPNLAGEPVDVFEHISRLDDESIPVELPHACWEQGMSKEEYVQKVEQIRGLIKEGVVYELNLCMEMYAEGYEVDPLSVFHKLEGVSPTPFTAFFKYREMFVSCASPERFMKKTGELLVSQPIKGTASRGRIR